MMSARIAADEKNMIAASEKLTRMPRAATTTPPNNSGCASVQVSANVAISHKAGVNRQRSVVSSAKPAGAPIAKAIRRSTSLSVEEATAIQLITHGKLSA